jgi:flagellar M-ring protein FliF
MPKRGLLRGDDKGAAAAVMLRLEPGRSLDAKEIAGVRHLIAAAVPELDVERVTVVDESGTLLGANATGDGARTELERELESRVVAVVEPAIGKGSVVARVTAEMDQAQEDRTESIYDPNKSVLASERTHVATTNASTPGAGDVGGAVANDPTSAASAPVSNANVKSTSVDDKTRTYNVSGTVTHRVAREPRLKRLSVAVLVNAAEAKDDEQIKKLTELAKRAVGFDEERGDMLELTSVAFRAEPVSELAPSPEAQPTQLPGGVPVGAAVAAAGVVALAAVALAFVFGRRRASVARASASKALEAKAGPNEIGASTVIATTATVKSESEATIAEVARDKARMLAGSNPERAALILEAWLREAGASEEPAAANTNTNVSNAKEARHG